MPTQIASAPAPAKKMNGVAYKNVRQWSGASPEALTTPPAPEHEATTTRDKPGYMCKGNVKAIAGLQHEGQGTQGGM